MSTASETDSPPIPGLPAGVAWSVGAPTQAGAPTEPGSGPRVQTGQVLVFPELSRYHEVAESLQRGGFEMLSDLCAVDYLTHPGRSLPGGIRPERFEVVANLLSMEHGRRVRLRVQVPAEEPVVDSLWDIYPGAEAMEREAYDLFGIVFRGHPDLTRILMPEEWEGHPLRKDYAVGRVPVQFKEAPGPR